MSGSSNLHSNQPWGVYTHSRGAIGYQRRPEHVALMGRGTIYYGQGRTLLEAEQCEYSISVIEAAVEMQTPPVEASL